MNFKYSFYVTLYISVIVQVITGIIEIFTLFLKTSSSYTILKQLLGLEVFVQIIEGLFYFWLVINFSNVSNVTPKRYFDWAITTPTMLITFICYLIYSNHKQSGDTSNLRLFPIISQNSSIISYILSLNWIMLLFGYLGEMNIISTLSGVLLGFIPFLIYFFIIYSNFAYKSKNGIKLFYYFFFFWSIYGVAALFPYYVKNTFYNILDLFAKNFFGLYLSYLLLSQST